jgi:DNA-directed RNA polymerase specialized sigma24 family protein
VKTTSTISPEDFERLLAWLDPDRDRAAEKYEKIRQRLTKMLVCRGCWEAEDLVDETIDRVARKIGEIRENYVGDPGAYFGGVARYVHQEWLRKKPAASLVPDPVTDSIQAEEPGPEYDCLDDCLEHLTRNNRDLILEYY